VDWSFVVLSAPAFIDAADNQEAYPRFATGVTEDHLSQPLALGYFCP
jgi:hypothetical protein